MLSRSTDFCTLTLMDGLENWRIPFGSYHISWYSGENSSLEVENRHIKQLYIYLCNSTAGQIDNFHQDQCKQIQHVFIPTLESQMNQNVMHVGFRLLENRNLVPLMALSSLNINLKVFEFKHQRDTRRLC